MQDDKRISNFLAIGIVMALIGGGGMLFMMVGTLVFGAAAAAASGILGLIMVIGIGFVCYALFSGLSENKKLGSATTVNVIPDCTIIARFAVNQIGEMVFSDFDPEFAKLYVKIQPPNGRPVELKTSMPTWESALEGARGTASVQGDWLGKFEVQRPKPAEDANPYRPY